MLKFIRKLKDEEFDREHLKELYEKKNHIVQTTGDVKEIQGIQNEINDILYVPDLITVKTDTTKKDYKAICKNHFSVQMAINDKVYSIRYKRLCAGAGQLRRNSAFFVNEELYDSLEHIMLCGLTKTRIGKINLAKFSAYYSLYTSATNTVTTPNICVIPDFEYNLKDQTVDWIFTNDSGDIDIENRKIDFNMNAFDGSGMISPAMANIWKEDLSLDYLPSAFIMRGPWLKGLVSVFDFHKFAKEVAHTDKITDIYGTEYDIDSIDVILTKSQFKLWKKYTNWYEYIYYFKRYGHRIGVTRVNKKESDFVTPLNYQYVQSNNFTEDSIKALAKPTTEWIDGILKGDPLYVSLLMVGHHENDTIDNIESSLDSPIAKCLLYNLEILKDKYVKDKIRQIAQKKIDQAKIGKIFVEGSYDFLIPDLYAMAEHAFGMEVKGLLPEKCVYSRRWVEKGSKVISTQRSPLVAPAENQIMNVYSDDKCKEWFKYIEWGNIYSIWDLTIISQSDADFDGDIALTSDNPYLVGAIDPTLPVITYEKHKAKEQRLNFNTFANWDIKSFDSPIGGITNLASNMYAMLPLFDNESKERLELEKRIKIMRMYQGNAIDKTKGISYEPPKKEWSKRQKYIQIPDGATEEEITRINKANERIKFENSICCDKKAYFFGYVYPAKMQEYKNHKRVCDTECMVKFGMGINDLVRIVDKSPEQKVFIRNYYKYSPLFNSKCTMNILAKYIEDLDLTQRRNQNRGEFDFRCLMSVTPDSLDKRTLGKFQKLLRQYTRLNRDIMQNISVAAPYLSEDELKEMKSALFDGLYEDFENDCLLIESNIDMCVNYVIYVCYAIDNNCQKSLLWYCFGDAVANNVKNNSRHRYKVVENPNGRDYFGKKMTIIDEYKEEIA